MQTLIDRLITQLNTLVPFMSMAHNEVFSLVAEKYSEWSPSGQQPPLPSTFALYEQQIFCGAFLLGYSYSESFLADLINLIYHRHPEILPKKKEITYGDFLQHSTYESVLDFMIHREVVTMLFAGMDKIGRYMTEKLNLPWPSDNKELVRASYLRNCIIHNMGVADERLSSVSRYSKGEVVSLTATDVHEFGLMMRKLAQSLYAEAEQRHLDRSE